MVYANLSGAMKQQAGCIVEAMHATGVKRLIFISSMGIHGEVPGERYGSALDPYRDSAAVIEASDLDFTILRPGWFTRDEAIAYQVTQKGEPFKGHEVSFPLSMGKRRAEVTRSYLTLIVARRREAPRAGEGRRGGP